MKTSPAGIGYVVLSVFLGSGPDRGRIPLEWGEIPSIRTSVRPSPLALLAFLAPLEGPQTPLARPWTPQAGPHATLEDSWTPLAGPQALKLL